MNSAKSLIKFLLITLRILFLWTFLQGCLFLTNQIFPSMIGDENPTIGLPIVFKSTDRGNLMEPISDKAYWFEIYSATGVILTNGLPKKVLYISSIGIILNITGILMMISLICKMLENAKEGNFLVVKNAIRLRYIALLGIALLLLDKTFTIISSSFLSDKLEFPGLEFNIFNYYTYANWVDILFYLFLIIIAEAFRLGAQLKQENDLTI